MFKCILPFLLFFSIAVADLKLEKLLETKSISEYNAWINANYDKYKGLSPLLIQIIETKHGAEKDNYIDEYEIRYYDESGKFVKNEILKGWLDLMVVRENGYNYYFSNIGWGNRIIIAESNEPIGECGSPRKRTVKGKNGNIIFTTDIGLMPLGPKLYLQWGGESIQEILNNKGEVQNKISAPFGFSKATTNNFWDFSADSEFLITKIGDVAILFDSFGKVVWQKKFKEGIEVSIADNGSIIAIAEQGKVHLYDKNGIFKKTYNPFPSSSLTAVVSLSGEGRFLFVCARDEMCLYDIIKDTMLWKLESGVIPFPSQIFIGPEGTYLVVLANYGTICVFSYNGELVEELIVSDEISFARFLPNLILLDTQKKIYIYEIKRE